VKASSKTIVVPDDWKTIHAIDFANDGDTVFVKSSSYTENTIINKIPIARWTKQRHNSDNR